MSTEVFGEERLDSPPGILGVFWIWFRSRDSQQWAKNRAASLGRVHKAVAGVWILLYIVNYAKPSERDIKLGFGALEL